MRDIPALRADLDQMDEIDNANFYIVAGRFEDAARVLDRTEKTQPPSTFRGAEVPWLRGLLALRRGNPSTAIRLLQQDRTDTFYQHTIWRAMILAEAFAMRGDTERAIATLAWALKQRTPANDEVDPFWWDIQVPLAELYHQVGRVSDARPIEADLSRSMAVADQDFRFVVNLKRLQSMH